MNSNVRPLATRRSTSLKKVGYMHVARTDTTRMHSHQVTCALEKALTPSSNNAHYADTSTERVAIILRNTRDKAQRGTKRSCSHPPNMQKYETKNKISFPKYEAAPLPAVSHPIPVSVAKQQEQTVCSSNRPACLKVTRLAGIRGLHIVDLILSGDNGCSEAESSLPHFRQCAFRPPAVVTAHHLLLDFHFSC